MHLYIGSSLFSERAQNCPKSIPGRASEHDGGRTEGSLLKAEGCALQKPSLEM